MIPHRSQSSNITTETPRESIPQRLSRLRSEQTSRPRYNSSSSTSRASTTTAAWLRPVQDHGTNGGRRERSRVSGPPPPPSWKNLAGDRSPSLSAVPTKQRQRRLIERRKLAEPLVATAGRTREGGNEGGGVDSLFFISGQTLAQDLSVANDSSLLLEYVGFLPMHLKVRLLEEVFANWRNEVGLTNEGARELLRIDTEEDEEEEEEEDCLTESYATRQQGDEDEWDQVEEEETGNISLFDSFSSQTRLSATLTSLNLSFSLISLPTLHQILLRPAPASSSSTSTSVKFLSNFPHLQSLILVSTKRLRLLHDQFFIILSSILSLRELSLAGNSLTIGEEEEEANCCSPRLFIPRLASSTPLLRTLDLSYITGGREDIDLRREVKRVDWEVKWLDLKLLGLRSDDNEEIVRTEEKSRLPNGLTVIEVREETGSVRKERFKKELRGLVAEKRRRGKWIDVIL
ncbi:uncharacterized protein JCM6883_001835 [Sporobolomyces salmoneus]|uniref:uncharacterized protein n=1 Tax=Sporobolomyces salmoneus TaxID=183962 RepID=UPI0031713C71